MAFCSSPPRTPPPPAMPPLLPASAAATRFAAHWVADALAGDEALEFSVLKALVGASSESLAGAPEATRERVALRCLEEVSTVIAAGGDAAATGKALRADGARSCEDLLLQLVGEVGSSGNFEKDLLPPFSQDIQDIICIKKHTLPKTSFELLREVDPEITHMAPPSQLEQNATSQFDNDQSLCSSQDHVNIEKPRLPGDNGELQKEALQSITEPLSNHVTNDHTTMVLPQCHREISPSPVHYVDGERPHDGSSDLSLKDPRHEELSVHTIVNPDIDSDVLPANASEPEFITAQDTAMISQPHSNETHLSALQHDTGEKANQDLDDVSAIIKPVEKDHFHEELTQQASVLPSIISNGAIQAGQFETNHQPEASYLSEGNTRENTTDIQKSASVPRSAQDGDGESVMKISNKENFGDASVEISVPSSHDSLCGTAAAGLLAMTNRMPSFAKDLDINDSLGDLSQQDLCIKCGKDGQLLKCSNCLLAAHDSCFGSSATFQETGLFYCPVCSYTKGH
ncbi:hypothetical protein HU200_005855 [Digitaria exilis]|uniref:Zinc finger PHD-type domain-containing protein n=1 Tax=Digitaria exilis TaxID=1010633 RepID=A0A835FSG6_9POAL|nr:hypothetical protein HU200_005855 [Digitaria exilis]